MTPKEKAQELYDKFYLAKDQDGFHSVNKFRAKQCALIAVEEIMKTLSTQEGNLPVWEYWSDVMIELNSL